MEHPAFTPPSPMAAPVHKKRLNSIQRFGRLLAGTFDPRAWLHVLRMVNYYNYSHVVPRRKVQMGPGAEISPNALFSNPENITAGARLHLGALVNIWAGPSARGRIVFGDDVAIGPRAFITAANYRFNDGSPIRSNPMDEHEVIFGNDVWVGAEAVVLPGTVLGDGAIVGAGSVVRGVVPPFTIVAGNPAREVGRRRNPAEEVVSPDATSTLNPRAMAIIARELAQLPAEVLDMPIEQSGVDSFDLITLRSAIEQGCDVHIPDREWAGITRISDAARLPVLSMASAQAHPAPVASAGVPAPVVAPQDGVDAPPLPGFSDIRRHAINMPQMALSGLGEPWLFKEIGDVHWALIGKFLKTPSAQIADDQGERLYATFTRLRLEVEPSLRGVAENDLLRMDCQLERSGAEFFFGHHRLATPRGFAARATTMSTFAKYGEHGRNTSLIKGAPRMTDPEALPSLPAMPEFGQEYRRRRGAEPADNLAECDYELLPPHDINGVGLLYFAAYPSVFDLCFEKVEGKGFLIGHSTVAKDICYFANSDPTETLRFRLHSREETDGLITHMASLYRTSDMKRMAELVSTKRRL